MSIAKNLKECRLAANMSQEQVAEQLFVTRQTVSGWETGRTQPDLETLGKLTALYGVGLDRIIYGVDYDDKKAGLRRKLILASRIFAGVVVAGMLISSVWRLVLTRMWPPKGFEETWFAWRNANDYFLMGLGAAASLAMIILLVLDAAGGDDPPLKRRWLLWGGTVLVMIVGSLLCGGLDGRAGWGWVDYTMLPLLQNFQRPTLYLLLSTVIWLVRKRMKK